MRSAPCCAVAGREWVRFFNQTGRLLSAIVRPAFWLFVFAAGFQNVLGVSIAPPYDTYVEYQVYILPGLIGIVLLFQGMQSSLSMVYDREMGVMRLLLTAPMPRWYLLFCKLASGVLLSIGQAYVVSDRRGAVRNHGAVERMALRAAGDDRGRPDARLAWADFFGAHPAARELRRHDELCNLSDVLPVLRALSALEAPGERRGDRVLALPRQSVHLRGRAGPLCALWTISSHRRGRGGGQRIVVFCRRGRGL